jgi:putative tricarboxylic transport membrane protein
VRFNDAVIGIAIAAFALAMMWHTRTFPSFPGQKYGPALFPLLLGICFLVAAAILIWRGLAERQRVPWLGLAPWTRDVRLAGGVALVLASIVFYILASDALGFLVTSFMVLAALMLWLGERWPTAFAVAAGMTLLIDWFFGDVMRIPLPRGLLDLVS